MKAAGSGRELRSDLCRAFRPTRQTSGGGSRQTDSRSRPPLESGRDADAPLLFWEWEFIHKGQNGGGGGSGTSVGGLKPECVITTITQDCSYLEQNDFVSFSLIT